MKTKIFLYFFLYILVINSLGLHAQVTIGSDYTPLSGALLDLKEYSSDNTITAEKGLGMPRINLVAVDDLQPCVPSMTVTDKADHVGLMVYNLTEGNGLCIGLYVWTGDEWEYISMNPCNLCIDPVVTDKKVEDMGGNPIPDHGSPGSSEYHVEDRSDFFMEVNVEGTEPFSYKWFANDNEISGATTSRYDIYSHIYHGGQIVEFRVEITGCGNTINYELGTVYFHLPPPSYWASNIFPYEIGREYACLDVNQSQPPGCTAPNTPPRSDYALDLNTVYEVGIADGFMGGYDNPYAFDIYDPLGLVDMSTVEREYWSNSGYIHNGPVIRFKFNASVLSAAQGHDSNNPLMVIIGWVGPQWGDLRPRPHFEIRINDCRCQ